jgi:hypothetical protein
MTDLFEQMRIDAAKDISVFNTFVHSCDGWGGKGVKVWEMASVGYSYRETQNMLGSDHTAFDQWWRERHGT